MLIFATNSLHFSPLLLVLLSSLFLLNPIQAQNEILSYCSSSWNLPVQEKNYTSGSQFETNLKNSLFPSLISSGSINGFFSTSSGNDPDTVYGVVQCRADISMDACKSCLQNSTEQIIQQCPNSKFAAIRLGTYCMLRYFSSKSQLSLILIKQISNNTQNASNPVAYNGQVQELLNRLSSIVISKPLKFETGSVEYNNSSNIYGMAQCTEDLSSSDCSNCLQLMTIQIPKCCSNATGAQVLSIDCFVRFENYMFYQPLPPSRSNVVGMHGSSKALHIVVPVIIGGALLLLSY